MKRNGNDSAQLPRLFAGGAALGLTVALALASCAERKQWTPYREYDLDDAKKISNGKEVDLIALPTELRELENSGCIGCHTGVGDPHPRLEMGCIDCHGGNGTAETIEDGHPEPRHPESWPEGGGNPERSYTLLNDENLDWIRFVNPGDLRVSGETCGTCHPQEALHVAKSIMTNASHFWGVASYANGILPNKHSILGESYSPEGMPQKVNTVPPPTEAEKARSVIPFVVPLPNWEVGQTANIFRVFEQGSRLGHAALGFNGVPVPLVGIPDKLEDPGRPNNRLSDRGLGTLNRVDLPLLNIFKTRLNDPMLSFLGTNDQPGDFRSSGCTACHMVYANDRDPVHSGPYAKFGNKGHGNAGTDPWGNAVASDPTLSKDEPGHPIQHSFTKAIPSSQCMVCHHHQPNSFVNSYFGFTMWTYDSDSEVMFPKEEAQPSDARRFEVMDRNPEGAAVRGLWGDRDFLDDVAELNPSLSHTQFADYHGHGWIFRAAMKMDRKGNLLDSNGAVVPYDDESKFEGVLPELGSDPSAKEIKDGAFSAPEGRAVHLMDIHAEKGMHCVDCHFDQDVHGDGKLYAEYQAAVEIKCQDCHGSITDRASLETSGPAAGAGHKLGSRRYRTPWGEPRFERKGDEVLQRSMLYEHLDWTVPQVVDTITPGHDSYNAKAYAAKTVKSTYTGGLAHGDEKLECYTCHTAWVTSCFGCHLPQEANWKTPTHHFGKKKLRNYATYNPQVARDTEFLLGIAGNVKGNRVAPVRSSSAILISSEDALRQKIYCQIPTIAANGMSSQAFNTHFPHTVRTKETRACDDCHVSAADDNNAWLAQTYLLGTNYVNFMGYRAYVGVGRDGFEAVRVTEWDEPQSVIGSNLHKIVYPDRFAEHVENERQLDDAYHHGGKDVRSLQLRGEYLHTASGEGGYRAYDVANVNNKGFSERLVTSPVSPAGQNTHVPTKFATAVALPTNNHIAMNREWREENKETRYEYDGKPQNMHESYRYAYVSDRYEGLVIIDVDCLNDFDPQNNFLSRALTFNPDGLLDGAEDLEVCGTTVYVCCRRGVIAVDISDPLAPRVMSEVGAPDVLYPTSIAVQFRYAFVTDQNGVQVIDVTRPDKITAVTGARVNLEDARDIYVARTYAYVSAGAQGMIVLDVERPLRPRIDQVFTGDGVIDDLNQVRVAMTNDSVFAYLADGRNGMHVLQLVTPQDGGRSAYGFSPRPRPRLIATYPTHAPALAISKGLDRDRAVDESGNQMAVFGRIGGRPMNLEERRRLFLDAKGNPYANQIPTQND